MRHAQGIWPRTPWGAPASLHMLRAQAGRPLEQIRLDRLFVLFFY